MFKEFDTGLILKKWLEKIKLLQVAPHIRGRLLLLLSLSLAAPVICRYIALLGENSKSQKFTVEKNIKSNTHIWQLKNKHPKCNMTCPQATWQVNHGTPEEPTFPNSCRKIKATAKPVTANANSQLSQPKKPKKHWEMVFQWTTFGH